MCVCAYLNVGVAANCASAVAQMAAASCVPEEKEEKDQAEAGDAITQGTLTYTHTCFIKFKQQDRVVICWIIWRVQITYPVSDDIEARRGPVEFCFQLVQTWKLYISF